MLASIVNSPWISYPPVTNCSRWSREIGAPHAARSDRTPEITGASVLIAAAISPKKNKKKTRNSGTLGGSRQDSGRAATPSTYYSSGFVWLVTADVRVPAASSFMGTGRAI